MPRIFAPLSHTPRSTPPPADLAAVARLIHLAFGSPLPACEQWLADVGHDNLRVLRDDGRVAACLAALPMGQHFGRRAVPMVGIAGVAVGPESRGMGYARDLMSACIRDLAGVTPSGMSPPGAGVALSCLYASTQTLYRQVGYEQAGHMFRLTLPLHRIHGEERAGTIRELTNADFPAVQECARRFAINHDGTLDRNSYIWNRIRAYRGVSFEPFGVFGVDPSCPDHLDGYIYLAQDRKPSGRCDVHISDLAFTHPAAGRRLLAMLSNFQTIGDTAEFFGSPLHPIVSLLPQQTCAATFKDYWMIRICDLKAAIDARGVPGALKTSAILDIRDDLVPKNAGRWLLRAEHGRATLEQATNENLPTLRADIRGFAAIYAGLYSPRQAVTLGWADADEAACEALEGLFTSGTPWMIDRF
jgi:predicted acetyltransferase